MPSSRKGAKPAGIAAHFSAPAGHRHRREPWIRQIVDAGSVPVIAAGAIMDGRGITAALKLDAARRQPRATSWRVRRWAHHRSLTCPLGCPSAVRAE
jgi:hypothetical protein